MLDTALNRSPNMPISGATIILQNHINFQFTSNSSLGHRCGQMFLFYATFVVRRLFSFTQGVCQKSLGGISGIPRVLSPRYAHHDQTSMWPVVTISTSVFHLHSQDYQCSLSCMSNLYQHMTHVHTNNNLIKLQTNTYWLLLAYFSFTIHLTSMTSLTNLLA